MSHVKLMKGHTFKDRKHKLKYPAVVEIKLDEIRCDVRRTPEFLYGESVEFRSFADKPLHNLGGWCVAFDSAMHFGEWPRLDMGVLVNRSFNDTYRYVRSSKGVPADLEDATVEFILFDDPNCKLQFAQRVYYLDTVASVMRDHGIPTLRPERVQVDCEEDVYEVYSLARQRGLEGLMVKTLDHVYELGKRIPGWLKVKPEEDADGIITEILQAHSLDGIPLDRAGSIRIVCEDGSAADCGGIDHELGRAMLANPSAFIGLWAEFVYMERDRQGGYRHPRFNRIREDKA